VVFGSNKEKKNGQPGRRPPKNKPGGRANSEEKKGPSRMCCKKKAITHRGKDVRPEEKKPPAEGGGKLGRPTSWTGEGEEVLHILAEKETE